MDRETARAWLDRYIDAWMSYDPEAISALFSEDIAYRYHPHDEPIVGRAAVVAGRDRRVRAGCPPDRAVGSG